MQQKIVILDFGSQTTQLIGRRLRELDTFCEILPYNKFPKNDPNIIGVILSGSPYSVYDPEAFKLDLDDIRGFWEYVMELNIWLMSMGERLNLLVVVNMVAQI